MKRLIAIGGLCVGLATASFAQYNVIFNGGDVFWNGTDPFVDVPLILQVDGPSSWDVFAIRFRFSSPHATIIGGRPGQTPNFYDFQSGPGSFTALGINATPVPPYAGGPVGNIYSAPGAAVDVALGLVGDNLPVFSNLDPTSEAYSKGVLVTRYVPENNPATRVPFTLRLHPGPLGGINATLSFVLVDQSLLRDGRRHTLGMRNATWRIVPEPASMIALGSGLVGLLALRRRRKA